MAKRTPELVDRLAESIPQYPDYTTESMLVHETGIDRDSIRRFLCFCHLTFMICEENGRLSRIEQYLKEN
jgi:hypothetical protein